MNVYQSWVGRYVALRLVRLPKYRKVDFRANWSGGRLTLQKTPDTVLAGQKPYSLRFYEKQTGWRRLVLGSFDYSKLGHAVLSQNISETRQGIERLPLKVNGADLRKVAGGWLSGWGGTEPTDFGITDQTVTVSSVDGWSLPCWQQKAKVHSDDWVIHVHGRGATAAETARNFELVSKLGYHSLGLHFRGDGQALRAGIAEGATLGLGTTEWVDLEAAVLYLDSIGAQKIMVVAWSYGAAVSLQFAKKSAYSSKVSGYFFDSPVISWRQTLIFQAKRSKAPKHFAALGEEFLRTDRLSESIGLPSGIDFEDFELDALRQCVTKPIFILHSRDDGYIPIEPCRDLANELPELVRLVEFQGARHCKLWNFDSDTYDEALTSFLIG